MNDNNISLPKGVFDPLSFNIHLDFQINPLMEKLKRIPLSEIIKAGGVFGWQSKLSSQDRRHLEILLHESMHYWQSICSPYGYWRSIRLMGNLGDIETCINSLGSSNSLRIPLLLWAKASNCPEAIKQLPSIISAYIQKIARYDGLYRIELDLDSNFLSEKLVRNGPNQDVPYYVRRDPWSKIIYATPIGAKAIMEGAATVLERIWKAIVESKASKKKSFDTIWKKEYKKIRSTQIVKDGDNEIAYYTVTEDYLINKTKNNDLAHNPFNTSLKLLVISDLSLLLSGFTLYHPGWLFVRLANTAAKIHLNMGQDQISASDLEKFAENVLKMALIKKPEWTTSGLDEIIKFNIKVYEEEIAERTNIAGLQGLNELYLKALNYRSKYKMNFAFPLLNFIDIYQEFPPLIIIGQDALRFGLPQQVKEFLHHYFASAILEQAFLKKEIRCPFANINNKQCILTKEELSCPTNGLQEQRLPKCLFHQILNDLISAKKIVAIDEA